MNLRLGLTSILFSLSLTACAKEVASTPTAASAGLVVANSKDLFTAYSRAVSAIDMNSMRLVSITQIFDSLLAATTDAPYAIDDLSLHAAGVHTALSNARARITSLSALYPTLGDLLDAGILTPSRPSTLAAFQTSLKAIYAPANGLSLAGVTTEDEVQEDEHGNPVLLYRTFPDGSQNLYNPNSALPGGDLVAKRYSTNLNTPDGQLPCQTTHSYKSFSNNGTWEPDVYTSHEFGDLPGSLGAYLGTNTGGELHTGTRPQPYTIKPEAAQILNNNAGAAWQALCAVRTAETKRN